MKEKKEKRGEKGGKRNRSVLMKGKWGKGRGRRNKKYNWGQGVVGKKKKEKSVGSVESQTQAILFVVRYKCLVHPIV